jgi:hypothetical protein
MKAERVGRGLLRPREQLLAPGRSHYASASHAAGARDSFEAVATHPGADAEGVQGADQHGLG